jgi:hypothetical protein
VDFQNPTDQDFEQFCTVIEQLAERLGVEPEPSIVLFKRGDFSVELYAPRGTDTQQPPMRRRG